MSEPLKAVFLLGTLKKKQVLSHARNEAYLARLLKEHPFPQPAQ